MVLTERIEVTMGLLSIFTSKKASLHQNGKDALDRGDLHEAFEVCSQLAHDGDPEGQCRLAYLYKSGVQDYDRAALWYMRAAEQGHAEAQCKLGFLCRSGKGVPQSDSQGAHWYREAAVQGYTEAQYNLARYRSIVRLTATVMPVTSSKAKPMKQFSLVVSPPDSLFPDDPLTVDGGWLCPKFRQHLLPIPTC